MLGLEFSKNNHTVNSQKDTRVGRYVIDLLRNEIKMIFFLFLFKMLFVKYMH